MKRDFLLNPLFCVHYSTYMYIVAGGSEAVSFEEKQKKRNEKKRNRSLHVIYFLYVSFGNGRRKLLRVYWRDSLVFYYWRPIDFCLPPLNKGELNEAL